MFSLTLVGLLVPLVLVIAGVVVLLALVNVLGVLFGLLWPTLPVLIALAILWRILRGARR